MKSNVIELNDDVESIIKIFKKSGYECYIVGGAIRDKLIGRGVNDWDFTTDANPDQILELARKNSVKSIPTGKKFGTITLLINDEKYEVTTYRIEKDYVDHREPSVVYYSDSLIEDLKRRDFTINSLAYDIEMGVVDYFEGISDLKNRIIRCVGEAEERFEEDALRMLRAIRFAAQLNFEIESRTMDAILKKKNLLTFLSEERIREELNKILLSNNPRKGLDLFVKTGIIEVIFPELKDMIGFEQNTPHHDMDVFDHTISVVEKTPCRLNIRLAALLHDIAKPKCYLEDETGVGHFYGHEKESSILANEFLKRLKYSNEMTESVVNLVKNHMHVYRGEYTDKAIKKFVNKLKPNTLYDFIDLQWADVMSTTHRGETEFLEVLKRRYEAILERNEAFSLKDLDINGNDLMNAGFDRGPIIGEILEYILEKVLENPDLNRKKKLMKIAETKFLN
ncbi:MAG: CCA tRNA nucleotidyltransferase [Tissierellales bacterium]|jgi:tRNA nucleotidyltransferase (CCA-adding enzyme)|nr:CCA tRNA nucleotidyltransferase [Tissierellales bacterium]